MWDCRCICGKELPLRGCDLRSGNTKSCGCKKLEMCREGNFVHGLSRTYVDQLRFNAISRCYDSNNQHFPDYGGRGIRICEELRTSTPHWLAILGHRPTKKHSVHRINNDGHYTCGQCAECLKCGYTLNIRWETSAVQTRHKRNSRMITIDGVTLNAVDWPARLGITRAEFRWHYTPEHRLHYNKWRRQHRAKKRKEKVTNS